MLLQNYEQRDRAGLEYRHVPPATNDNCLETPRCHIRQARRCPSDRSQGTALAEPSQCLRDENLHANSNSVELLTRCRIDPWLFQHTHEESLSSACVSNHRTNHPATKRQQVP